MTPRSPHASLVASAGCLSGMVGPLHQVLTSWLALPSIVLNISLLSLAVTLLYMAADGWMWTPLVFGWNCFVKPFLHGSSGDQQGRLNAFYAGQAHVYDKTRTHLLKGRETMLQLLAAHLKALPKPASGSRKPRIWVDIGGGTGWNVEQMDEYLPLTYFDKIYVVDLCQPLLDVARERCRQKGWKHVEFLCQDASQFVIPEWESGQLDPRGSLSAITMSYSMSMIPTFYQLLDRCDQVLDQQSGLMGVVDFYTSRSQDCKERVRLSIKYHCPLHTSLRILSCHDFSSPSVAGQVDYQAIGTQSKNMSFFAKWFWEAWFEMDSVHLHVSRRDYLEYKMGTIKTYNGRNNFLNTYFISIPYYVFLGCSRRRDVSINTKAFHEEAGSSVGINQGGLLTPVSPFMRISPPSTPADLPDFFTLGPSMLEHKGLEQTIVDMGAPLSPFHYQLRKNWRVPYLESKVHEQFRTHIYGWVWEDPKVDVERLDINSDDSVLAITSAGDNVLHYALAARCKAIHAVDMNPCQGNILELKLAAIHALEYADFWLIFGEGRHPDFEKILTTKLSPYLSSHAYAYWKTHSDQFSRNFYYRGYSGWALRVSQVAFALAAVRGSVKKLCQATSVEEQETIWRKKLRPVLLNKVLMKGFLGNPIFNWHALGVPQNQMNCFLKDGTIEDFVKATFDPIASLTTLKDDNYFYYLCLNGRYSRSSCPSYLKPEGFKALKSAGRTNTFKLHTDTILNVLRGLSDGSLTKIIVMDSMDWFDPVPASRPLPTPKASNDSANESPEAALESLKSELDYEILEMKRVLARGGHVVWRSAGKHPWYIQRFELAGFEVEAVDIREGGKAIDRVNFYASLYRAKKIE